MHPSIVKALYILLLAAGQVSAHGAIVKAVGDAGGQGSAIGIDPSTPRDGTKRNPFQQDSTRFKGQNADTCGQTVGAGENDIESGTSAVLSQNGNTLPQVTPGGELKMTLHQVNSDGAGPYTCAMDTTGTGQNWEDVTVTQNVAGKNSRNKDGAMTDNPLNIQIPAKASCTGNVAGQTGVCLARCMNAANAGPFGGCVPFQMAGGAAGGNSTTDAAATAGKAARLAREARRRAIIVAKDAVIPEDAEEEEEEDDE